MEHYKSFDLLTNELDIDEVDGQASVRGLEVAAARKSPWHPWMAVAVAVRAPVPAAVKLLYTVITRCVQPEAPVPNFGPTFGRGL